MDPQTVVSALSVLTVIGQLIVIAVAVLLVRGSERGLPWISHNALILMLVTAVAATLGSLYLSDIAGWTPCKLCWYQRIFMYPQVVLLALALWKKDARIAPYVLALSIVGALIATVHYGEQVAAALFPAEIDPNAPCDASGTSCRSTPFFRFGYITIPMMALTAFALNIVGSVALMRRRD